MARPMTPVEKHRFRGAFPGLDVDRAMVTGEATPAYNCIAWTVGVTNRWIWPGNTLAQFDDFYRLYGFARAGNGPIAAWGHSTATMTHGSISGPGHGPRWESKCGEDLRIQHGLNELAGSNYGRVIAFYDKRRATAAPVFEDHMKEQREPYFAPDQRETLDHELDRIDPDLRAQFEERFGAWKATWHSEHVAMSSDPHTRTVGPEFAALIALGPAILPLIVDKIGDPENFFALQLYDAMQTDERLLVQYESGDERIMEGEQGRAVRVIDTWFRNR